MRSGWRNGLPYSLVAAGGFASRRHLRYIAKDSEQYARIFAQQILRLTRTLSEFPKSGRVVPEYNDDRLREKIYGNYRLVYRIKEGEEILEIVTICHSARLIRDVFTEGKS